MKRIIHFLLVWLILASCRILSVGTNGYDSLPAEIKTDIIENSLFFVDEIPVSLLTPSKLDSILVSKPRVWVHFWVPGCEGFDPNSRFLITARKLDVSVLFIATKYDEGNLSEVASFSDTCSHVNLRLPSVSYYGLFVDRMMRNVNSQINTHPSFPNSRYGDYYVEFGELKFAGWEMDESKFVVK